MAAPHPRSRLNIRLTAWIFRNDWGFVARALELPVVSAPASTKRGAVKSLKLKMKAYVEEMKRERQLSSILNDSGFRGWIGDRRLNVEFYDFVSISVPLPPDVRAEPEEEPTWT